jgi:hypothetical protein
LPGDRDGWRSETAVGLTHRLDGRQTLAVTAVYEQKGASYQPFAYRAPRVEASYSATLDRGIYVGLFGSVRFSDYRAADPVFLAAGRRKDTVSYARLAAGAPLSAFTTLGATGDLRENLTLEAAATYTRRSSQAPVADYDSFGAELRLLWRFGDGG